MYRYFLPNLLAHFFARWLAKSVHEMKTSLKKYEFVLDKLLRLLFVSSITQTSTVILKCSLEDEKGGEGDMIIIPRSRSDVSLMRLLLFWGRPSFFSYLSSSSRTNATKKLFVEPENVTWEDLSRILSPII